MSQDPNTPQGKVLGTAPRAGRVQQYPAMTAEQLEAAALILVQAHQDRVLAAARLAFRRPSDPLRAFAEAVAASGVVLIKAMLQISMALSERLRTAVAESQVTVNSQERIMPAGDLLSLLGIYPADVIRFRLWMLGVGSVVLLATYGAGVLTGRSSVQSPALETITLPQ